MAREFQIFISHSWDYSDDLEKLRNLLEERGYFNVKFTEVTKDEPINSANAVYIKSRLKAKIVASKVFLALAGIYASHSDWMMWELQTAQENGIPIIGVIPRGQERISLEVSSRSMVNVKWNTESIVEAIRIYAL